MKCKKVTMTGMILALALVIFTVTPIATNAAQPIATDAVAAPSAAIEEVAHAIAASAADGPSDPTVKGAADAPASSADETVSASAPLPLYKLVVDVSDQNVLAYQDDVLVRTMICSTGLPSTPTPLGTYSENTGPGYRWHYFKDFNCWAQYSYYIEGEVMFHSVLYAKMDEDTQTLSSGYNLGKPASHGTVRLAVEDAQWIYENCTEGTTVIVQD